MPSGLEREPRLRTEVALCILSPEDRPAWWEGLALPGLPGEDGAERVGLSLGLWSRGGPPAWGGHALARTAAPSTPKPSSTCHSGSVTGSPKSPAVIQQLFTERCVRARLCQGAGAAVTSNQGPQ